MSTKPREQPEWSPCIIRNGPRYEFNLNVKSGAVLHIAELTLREGLGNRYAVFSRQVLSAFTEIVVKTLTTCAGLSFLGKESCRHVVLCFNSLVKKFPLTTELIQP